MARLGLDPSFGHPENGMIKSDMIASLEVANALDEVIIFRSTGPWSRRWIEGGYPTKNFHVKGKNSDWGPQAGFVPYLGKYSKVGHDLGKANDGTAANDDGLKHHFAAKTQLTLTMQELQAQVTMQEELPPRRAIDRMDPIPDSKDFFLFAARSGDGKVFAFRAVASGSAYQISVYADTVGANPKQLMYEKPVPLEVMTSSEAGAGNRPMTGDYDLMSVCPRWGNYGSKSVAEIAKPGLTFNNKGLQPGLAFGSGASLDKALDMRSNTGAKSGDLKKTFQGLTKRDGGVLLEHGDMGNLTPRILRCINMLNAKMGATGAKSPFRRVHHNAESHRNHIFGAITGDQMKDGDGFPLTVFQPRALIEAHLPVSRYQSVATLESLGEFKEYAALLNDAGYFVPRNWTWGMSIRDRQHTVEWPRGS